MAATIGDLEAKNVEWSVILAVMGDMTLKLGQSHLAQVLVDAAHADHAAYAVK